MPRHLVQAMIGPDGFTRLAGDAAYDRLHGVDGAEHPRFGTPAGFPDAYAAFVGSEAELARLKSAVARVGHRGTCPVFPCDCWWVELAPLVGEDQ